MASYRGQSPFRIRDFVDDEPPRRARLGACLSAEAATRDEHDRLGVREAFVHHRRILRLGVAVLASTVGALGRDKMLDAELMADKVDAHPIGEVEPLPVEAELADRRVFGKQDALLPARTRLALALLAANRRASCVRDLAPCALDLQELDFHDDRFSPYRSHKRRNISAACQVWG